MVACLGLKLYLSSKIKGNVLLDGKPVEGATLKRTVGFQKKIIDETISNSMGEFSFPEVIKFSLWGWLPHNPSVTQFILIWYKDIEYQAWGYQKGNYDDDGELFGRKMNLRCDLANENMLHKVSDFKSYKGICELV
ncbi:MAG: hypothetical protein COA79_23255 [Planctomycetota bacterium]|nr:MAG: hypothetical protein COA79_23255 [Planctomycetota bacterium]